MNPDVTRPMLDLGAEAGIAPLEYGLIAALAGLALAYLLRGFLRRRSRAAAAGGCSGCPGCAATGSCPSARYGRFEIDAERDR